jgi:hypothetical protein
MAIYMCTYYIALNPFNEFYLHLHFTQALILKMIVSKRKKKTDVYKFFDDYVIRKKKS